VIAELVKARVKAHAELSKEGLDSAKENEIVMELKV
jgi:hypothetical protein